MNIRVMTDEESVVAMVDSVRPKGVWGGHLNIAGHIRFCFEKAIGKNIM